MYTIILFFFCSVCCTGWAMEEVWSGYIPKGIQVVPQRYPIEAEQKNYTYDEERGCVSYPSPRNIRYNAPKRTIEETIIICDYFHSDSEEDTTIGEGVKLSQKKQVTRNAPQKTIEETIIICDYSNDDNEEDSHDEKITMSHRKKQMTEKKTNGQGHSQKKQT